MGYKFVVTGQLIPHEIGAVIEFAEMPPESLMHRLRPADGSELVVATPQDLDLTDRKQISEKLKELGIEFDGRKSAAELAELLPKE